MKNLMLYNTAHPLAESGKPIFIPFGEWDYDGRTRQRLDRAHGEAIANELNARVAKGEPGIPVYQGHPDVPELAAKYPDKGALGWVTKIELANESPDGRAVSGLALTVEWDRDPGKGFRWFSPYWLANERDGSTYIVGKIASIGLVNNPNIPEFRLANERDTTMKTRYSLPPRIVELAAKRDRLANEANFDESKHPRADDGKFTSVGGGGGSDSGSAKRKILRDPDGMFSRKKGFIDNPDMQRRVSHSVSVAQAHLELGGRSDALRYVNDQLSYGRNIRKMGWENYRTNRKAAQEKYNARRGAHIAAITLGFKYNPKTHQYE